MVCAYAPSSIFDNNSNAGRNQHIVSSNVLSPTSVISRAPLSSSCTSMWSHNNGFKDQRTSVDNHHFSHE